MKTKNILLVLFASFSIIPLVVVGIFCSVIFSNLTHQKLISSYQSSLEQLDVILSLKFQKVQKNVDLMLSNVQLQQLTREVDFSNPSPEWKDAVIELDDIFTQYLYNEKDIQGIILFPTAGGAYTYNSNLDVDDPIKFMLKAGKVYQDMGQVTWLGLSDITDSSGAPMFMAATVLSDINYKKDGQTLGTVYFVMERDFLSASVPVDNPNILTQVFDQNGRKIYESHEDSRETLWDYPVRICQTVFKEQEGAFRSDVSGEPRMFVFNRSSYTDWFVMQSMSYSYYSTEQRSIITMLIAVGAVVMLFVVFASYLVAAKIFQPLNLLLTGMRDMSLHKPVTVPKKPTYTREIQSLFDGFNSMTVQINELFEQIRAEETQKNDAVVRALQYQINPHFLYNTLAAVRIKAMTNGDMEVAEIMLTLSRLLKNTLTQADSLITVSEDVNNIKDYVSILQVRYADGLRVEFCIEPETLDLKTTGMLLQPIVENAVHHGLHDLLSEDVPERSAALRISISRTKQYLVMEVWDNGAGIPPERVQELLQPGNGTKRGSIGLRNIYDRIVMKYGHPYGMEIESEVGQFTLVRLKLPILMGNTLPPPGGDTYV